MTKEKRMRMKKEKRRLRKKDKRRISKKNEYPSQLKEHLIPKEERVHKETYVLLQMELEKSIA